MGYKRVRHGKYMFRVTEGGVYISGNTHGVNLVDPEFQEALDVAHEYRQLLLAKAGLAEMPGYVYLASGDPRWKPETPEVFYKIGSTNNRDGRLSYGITEMMHVIKCESRADAFQLEAHYHSIFRNTRLTGEKEWFKLNDEAIERITALSTANHKYILRARETEKVW